MELIYKYSEHLKEYCVEENDYSYYMTYTYILHLQIYLKETSAQHATPVDDWYLSLKEIEQRIVTKISRDKEKRSSIW